MLLSIALNNLSHPEGACDIKLEVQIRAWIPEQHQLAQTWSDIYLEITDVENALCFVCSILQEQLLSHLEIHHLLVTTRLLLFCTNSIQVRFGRFS